MKFLPIILFLGIASVVAGPVQETPEQPEEDLSDVIGEVPESSNFGNDVLAYFPLEMEDITTALNESTNFTVTAPENGAYEIMEGGEEGGIVGISSDMTTIGGENVTVNMTTLEENGTWASLNSSLSYYFIPDELIMPGGNDTTQAENATSTIQILATLFDDEAYVNLPNASAQVIVFNTTGENMTVSFGAFEAANVLKMEMVESPEGEGKNGSVLVVDSMIVPPVNVSTTAKLANLTAFLAAAEKADLLADLDSMIGVTIFAPSNAAFENITDLPEEDLRAALRNHVVQSNETVWYSTTLVEAPLPVSLNTTGDATLEVTELEGGLSVNGSMIEMANILTANGVIHIIDQVLQFDEEVALFY